MNKFMIAVVAPLLGAAPAIAGDVSTQGLASAPASAPVSGGFRPSVSLSGVFGEQTEALAGSSYDVAGVRVGLGHDLGNGFSFAGRFEHLEGDGGVLGGAFGGASSAFGGGDLFEPGLDSNEFRALLNYGREVAEGISLFGGIGYGWQSQELLLGSTSVLEGSGHGVLANVGANFVRGSFFGSLVYTHAFTIDRSVGIGAGATALGGSGLGGLGNAQLLTGGKEDLGFLEATVGYNITEQLAATLAVETQVVGDTFVEKDWVTAIGLKYNF